MWQLRQAIFPVSPMAPSCPSWGVPVWIGPERRGSKKSFCPSSAASAESRYLLLVSLGSSGSGESVAITARSAGEKMSLSGAVWVTGLVPAGAYALKDHTDNRHSSTRAESRDFIRAPPSGARVAFWAWINGKFL